MGVCKSRGSSISIRFLGDDFKGDLFFGVKPIGSSDKM